MHSGGVPLRGVSLYAIEGAAVRRFRAGNGSVSKRFKDLNLATSGSHLNSILPFDGTVRSERGNIWMVAPSGFQGHESDRDVIRASLRDPAAFGQIFDRYVGDITRFLVRRSDLEAAEDLVAETFITAFRVRASFDPAFRNARPWLYGIATNVLRHHRRGRERRRRLLDKWRLRAENEDPGSDVALAEMEERLEAQRRLPELEAALATLDPEARDALLLLSYAGLTYEEIGEALNVPIGTVRSRISRSRRKLRELLLPEGATTE